VLDVTDEAAARAWMEKCNAEAPLEVVFSNAGIGTGIENEENVRRTFATNVGGCLNVVLPAIGIFRRNAAAGAGSPRRQIVITASIAGYAPLSTCPAYAATKAAMKSWALSLRGMLKREGIWVNAICPGFIRSRITDRNTCPMPFFMEADEAAKIILKRADRNVGMIAFPWPMRLATWWLSTLPYRVNEWINSMLPEKTAGTTPSPF
jgi:NAD(P)-dependent dehydrogenase (short-subunit alcohol dehydrogenase family)